MRKLGCCAGNLLQADRIENIARIRAAGFDTTFFSLAYDDLNAEPCFAAAEKCGLQVESLHAPFVGVSCMWQEESDGDRYTEHIRRVIDIAGDHGVPYVVLHATQGAVPRTSNIGLVRFGKLLSEAEKCGVTLAMENVVYHRHLGLLFSTYPSPNLGFCFDFGHQHCYTPGLDCIKLFGERLCCVHANDNLGISYSCTPSSEDDLHRLPFDGEIDFAAQCKAVAQTGYTASLMLEVSNKNGFYDDLTPEAYYARAYAAAVRLRTLTDGN